MMTTYLADEDATRAAGAELARSLRPGMVVFLTGPLGAGKTTLVRGLLAEMGWTESVRSPTFDLLHVYPTDPPVLHADLYRVASWEGTGIEDYLEDHVLLIEWPDRAEGLVSDPIRVEIGFEGEGRSLEIVGRPL